MEENKNLGSKNIFSRRLLLFSIIIILGFIHCLVEYNFIYSLNFVFFTFIPQVLGSAMAMGFIPAIIALVRKIMKKRPNNDIYTIYYFIIALFFIFSLSSL